MVFHGRAWHMGTDRRGPSDQSYRSWVFNDYESPIGNALGLVPSLYGGPTAYGLRPFCVPSAPFTTDANGQPFPAGTVWVVALPQGSGSPSRINLRSPGTSTNPISGTQVVSGYGGYSLEYVYNAIGIPSGSTGSVTVKGTTSGTVYATFSVSPNGSTFQYDVPAFTLGSTDTTITITSTWTGTPPIAEGFSMYWLCAALIAGGVAVPSTLPAGYTARLNSDNNRGGSYFQRNGGDPRRLRSGPYVTFETMGVGGGGGVGNIAAAVGVPGWSTNGSFWLAGNLVHTPTWGPVAIGNSTTYSCGAGYISGFTGGSGTFTCRGVNSVKISFQYTAIGGTTASGDTFTWTLTQDGATIGSGTATGTAIQSIPSQIITATTNAAGTNTTFTLTVSGSGGTTGPPINQPNWECNATVVATPRCDIPLPYTCVGPGNIGAPGGYLASAVANVTNGQPLQRLASGVTSVAFGSSPGCAAFLPTTDGWWQVLKSGVAQQYIGEDEFGCTDLRTARRGRTGRPFYCRADTGGTLVLTAFTPPAPTVVSSGGTSIPLNASTWAAWCSVTFPTTASYRVIFNALAGAIVTGMVVDMSTTDPQVVNPAQTAYFEPFNELSSGHFQGTGIFNTPPTSPSTMQSFVIGSSPTGAFVGHANQIALWDVYAGGWNFFVPTIGSYLSNQASGGVNYWFDGTQWWPCDGSGAQAMLTYTIQATSGQTVYFCIQPFSTETGSPLNIQVGFVTP